MGQRGLFGSDVTGPNLRGAAVRRILIVDDHPTSRSALSLLLADEGHEVRSAASPEEALQYGNELVPSAAVVSIGSAHAQCELIRRLADRHPQCRVLAVLGEGSVAHVRGEPELVDDARELENAGAYACLQKPIDLSALLKLLL